MYRNLRPLSLDLRKFHLSASACCAEPLPQNWALDYQIEPYGAEPRCARVLQLCCAARGFGSAPVQSRRARGGTENQSRRPMQLQPLPYAWRPTSRQNREMQSIHLLPDESLRYVGGLGCQNSLCADNGYSSDSQTLQAPHGCLRSNHHHRPQPRNYAQSDTLEIQVRGATPNCGYKPG